MYSSPQKQWSLGVWNATSNLALDESPLLKGGKMLRKRMHDFVLESKADDSDLVREARAVLKWSPVSPVKAQTSIDLAVPRPLSIPPPSMTSPNESHIESLRQKIKEHEVNIESMQKTISTLREETTCYRHSAASMKQTIVNLREERYSYKKISDKLNRDVRTQQQLLQNTLQETHKALDQHRVMLARQEMAIQKIQRGNREVGLFSETLYVAVCLYLIKTPLVVYTIHFVVLQFDKAGKYRKWFPHFVKFFFMMQIIKVLRRFDRSMGFSRSIHYLLSATTSGIKSFLGRSMLRITSVNRKIRADLL